MTIKPVGGVPTQPSSDPTTQTPPKTEAAPETAAVESPTNPLDVLLHGDDASFYKLIDGASPAQLGAYMQMLSSDSEWHATNSARLESQLDSNPDMPREKRRQLESQKQAADDAIRDNNLRTEIIMGRLQ